MIRKTLEIEGFTWGWCETCRGSMVICKKCGNNCCNGGYGLVKTNGERVEVKNWRDFDVIDCDECPKSYEAQDKSKGPTLEDFL